MIKCSNCCNEIELNEANLTQNGLYIQMECPVCGKRLCIFPRVPLHYIIIIGVTAGILGSLCQDDLTGSIVQVVIIFTSLLCYYFNYLKSIMDKPAEYFAKIKYSVDIEPKHLNLKFIFLLSFALILYVILKYLFDAF